MGVKRKKIKKHGKRFKKKKKKKRKRRLENDFTEIEVEDVVPRSSENLSTDNKTTCQDGQMQLAVKLVGPTWGHHGWKTAWSV